MSGVAHSYNFEQPLRNPIKTASLLTGRRQMLNVDIERSKTQRQPNRMLCHMKILKMLLESSTYATPTPTKADISQ